MRIFTVVDNDTENGLQLYTFDDGAKANTKFEEIIESYRELLGEFGNETEIHDEWAVIIMTNGYEAGRVSIEKSTLL